jgi:hypothetical protein
MGRVLFHSKRRACHRVSALLLVTLASLALGQGNAHAAVTAPAAPPSGTINQSAPQSVNFNGQATGSGITSGSDCALPDLTQLGTCSQFDLEVGTAGSVDVVINWATSVEDLDLFVYLCNTGTAPAFGVATFDTTTNSTTTVCTLVPNGSSQIQQSCDPLTDPTCPAPAEGVTFNAQQTVGCVTPTSTCNNGNFYRIIVTPFFAVDGAYTGCAGYSGSCGPVPGSTPTPPPPPSVQQFTTGCAADTTNNADRKMSGGADMPAPNPQQKAHAAVNVRRKNGEVKGKINYKVDDPLKFRSDTIGCATFTDGTKTQSNSAGFEGKVDVRGTGTLQETGHPKQQVCFESHVTDNGEPGSGRDMFDITFYPLSNGVCNTAAPLPESQLPTTITGGNFNYHLYCKDDD